jgi:hypothetical protein
VKHTEWLLDLVTSSHKSEVDEGTDEDLTKLLSKGITRERRAYGRDGVPAKVANKLEG